MLSGADAYAKFFDWLQLFIYAVAEGGDVPLNLLTPQCSIKPKYSPQCGFHIPNTQPINGPYFLEVEISDKTVQFADILRAAAFAMAGPILRRHTGSGTRLYWHRRRLPGGIRRRMAAISQVLLQVQRAVSECDGRHQVQKGASMGEQVQAVAAVQGVFTQLHNQVGKTSSPVVSSV